MSEEMATDEQEVNYDYLLDLAREKSSEGRAKLTETILDLFEDKGELLSDRERSLMFGILRSVVRDVESSIRGAVGRQLAGLPDAPVDLVKVLANDNIEVAYPVLTESGVLRDAELIEVISHRSMEHQLAVAIRHSVSENVSQALVETGNERVVVTLLKNENAQISQNTMEYLVEQSKRVDTFQEPILQRKELDPDLAQRMFLWVSAALREYILDNYDLDKDVVDDLLEQVAHQDPPVNENERAKIKAKELAEVLANKGMVTPEMLISALTQGEVSLFIALFCRLTGLRDYLARRLLFEPGGEGLAICSKAVGLTADEFKQIFILSQMVRARQRDEAEATLGSVLWIFEDMSREDAARVLRNWRRDTGYLSAIRQIQRAKRRHE